MSWRVPIESFPGEVKMHAGANVPDGWLLCDGSAISRDSYSDLFNEIGIAFGAGDGATTFNLPDMRGRAPIGVGTGTGLTGRALAATGGEENHALVFDELPEPGPGVGYVTYGAPTSNGNWPFAAGTESLVQYPLGNGHNTMQPFLAINFIIRY